MDNKELIIEAQNGDKLALEKLLKDNERLIWSIVHRFSGRGVELQDLFQIGSIGFVKAIKGYEVGFGTEFSTYAVPKIMGEIRRFFRDDGMIKVSRDVKSKSMLINVAISKLEQISNEPIRISDIILETGFTEEEIIYAQSATNFAYSLEAPLNEDGIALKDTISSGHTEDDIIDKLSLKNAIETLPTREKMVIFLRFFKDMTQQKTADILGLSQVQVSRTEKKAISLMKEALL